MKLQWIYFLFVCLFMNVRFTNLCLHTCGVMKFSVLYSAMHYGEYNDHWFTRHGLYEALMLYRLLKIKGALWCCQINMLTQIFNGFCSQQVRWVIPVM